MIGDSADSTGPRPRQPRWWHGVVGVAGVVLAVWIFDRWFMPPHEPGFRDPSAWDVLIERRWVIGALRLIGLVVAAYIAISVFARIRKGQWLSGVGPFTIDDATQAAIEDRHRLVRDLVAAENTIEALRDEVNAVLTFLAPVDPVEGGEGIGGDDAEPSGGEGRARPVGGEPEPR